MKEQPWTTHLEFLVIFITLVGGIYFNISNTQQMSARIDQVNTRTDQLYEMFIDVVKESHRR